MSTLPVILWNTFGLVGAASALAWTAAAGLLVAAAWSRNRLAGWTRAAALAAAACLLVTVTSARIRSIEVDRTAETRAAEAGAREATQTKLRGRAAAIRFAEDTAADQADVAGVTVAEERGAYERAVADELAKLPAYKRRGRQQRKGGGRAEANDPAADAAAATDATPPPDAPQTPEPTETTRRRLPEAELIVADRFDRANRFTAWSLLVAACGLVAYEYARRYHTTFDAACPVPLAGTPLDGLFAKQRVVDGAEPLADHAALAAFLGGLARKGESFVACVATDPLGGAAALPRLTVGPLAWQVPVRTFPAATVAADGPLAEIVLESAWYGRACTVLVGAAGADAVLAGIAAALDRRHRCRARARTTLSIVWTLPEPAPAAAVDTLARLAEPMNLRLVVARP